MSSSPSIVAYYRVSTKKQGASGLGLDAQQAVVADFAAQRGTRILAAYTDVESGKLADRPELARAIAHAKRAGATLVVAKLDRLARNFAFTAALLEAGVEFIACDNPHANRLTIHILAAVAEGEARRISERTTAALAVAKRRGVQLGASRPECRHLTAETRQRGSVAAGEAVRQQADEAYTDLRDFLTSLRPAFSFAQIATVLNLKGEKTRRGKPWSDVAVLRACRRLQIA